MPLGKKGERRNLLMLAPPRVGRETLMVVDQLDVSKPYARRVLMLPGGGDERGCAEVRMGSSSSCLAVPPELERLVMIPTQTCSPYPPKLPKKWGKHSFSQLEFRPGLL